jgi:hypothetical protein
VFRRRLELDVLEERTALSGSASSIAAAGVTAVGRHAPTVFTATLTPAGVVVPDDSVTKKPIAAKPDSTDPASGKIVFTLSRNGQELWVVGKLSHISNVSAVTVHDLNFPGATPNYPWMLGQTVAVLLMPGNASGPHAQATFRTVIKAQYLTGPLVGHPLSDLIKDMRQVKPQPPVYVNVQTNNGVDSSSVPAGPGNFPFGEIRGPVV